MTPLSRSDLADFPYFLAVARHRSFRRASQDLGVTASALSHAMRGLEARLGVRLLNRTSRSVTLTVAGESLFTALTDPFEAIGEAVDLLNAFRDQPAGRVRLNVPGDAATHLLAPVLPAFIARYPDVKVEVAVANKMVDVIGSGFDAGIRYGGTVPEDMVAVRLSADIRWLVVASPDYVARRGAPARPEDLMAHECLRMRMGTNEIYKWEFDAEPSPIEIDAPGAITVDEAAFAFGLVERGAALGYVAEFAVADRLRDGRMVTVLDDWPSIGPGFYAYYPSRRQVPTALRLLIDFIREQRPLGL